MQPQPFGKYILLERIGAGGMAEVFRATTRGVGGFEKELAIKRILPQHVSDTEFISMFIDEAKIASSLQHANIAQIFDLGCIDGSYFIAMEYVHGHNLGAILRDSLARERPLPIPLAVHIAREVALGLYAAHTAVDPAGIPLGIIHRDISPQNVQIGFSGEVKIIDFGVAKARSKLVSTSAGTIRGKLVYMAPEQVRAQAIDGRADLFALGLVLYKMLVGKNPFEAPGELEVVSKLRRCQIDPPRSLNDRIPPELEQVLLRALQRRPEDRQADAHVLHQELSLVLRAIAPSFSSHWLADYLGELYRDELIALSAAASGAARFDVGPDPGEPLAASEPAPPPPAPSRLSLPLLASVPAPAVVAGHFTPSGPRSASGAVQEPTQRAAAPEDLSSTYQDPGTGRRPYPLPPTVRPALQLTDPLSATQQFDEDGEEADELLRPRPEVRAGAPTTPAAPSYRGPGPGLDGGAASQLRQRRRLLVGGVLGTLLALAVVLFFLLRPSPAPLAPPGQPAAAAVQPPTPGSAAAADAQPLPAPAAGQALLDLQSTPPGAEVQLDGRPPERGARTPYRTRTLAPGRHQLALVLPGYGRWEREILARADETLRMHAEIREDRGRLTIRSSPAGAMVRVGEELRGQTPLELTNLPQGRPLTVALSLAGHRTLSEAVVLGDQPLRLELALPPTGGAAPPGPASPPAGEPPTKSESAARSTAPARDDAQQAAPPPAARPAAAAVAPPVAPPPARGEPGFLSIVSVPWAHVAIDGKDTGKTTPLQKVQLSAGRHAIRFTSPANGATRTLEVTIKPGESHRLSADLRTP